MAVQDSGSSHKPSKGYGKRSRTQWMLIYLIAAIVVYGVIYYLFIRESGGSGGLNY